MTKRTNRSYTAEFKQEAVALVTEQGYSVPKAAASLGITDKLLYNWKAKVEAEQSGASLNADERAELLRLRKENKELRMEKEILKKASALLPKRNQVTFKTIKQLSSVFPVVKLCKVMKVSRSAYYAWLKRPAKVITVEQLNLYRKAKYFFKKSRNSLGYRELRKKLRSEGFSVSDYGVQKLMATLGLVVTQRVAYKVTTKRKHSDAVADNLLNQNFNPVAPNQVWAGDVTYLRTGEGWMYLAIVMDLYSRRIVGWHIDKRMTTDLVSKAMMKAYNLRQPPKSLVFHSDRGSQYTSKQYRQLLWSYGVRASMGDVGACWDNAVVERFFGSLKHDWLLKVPQPIREHMRNDVAAYMRYYNLERLHTAHGDLSPVEYEQSSLKKVS
ncbi:MULTISPECIES: IS3 family transposase [unclassified Pseudoalteromonas]|uniref:IS3 family transposase n=3 Tax=Pseudoalteromonas TaxID=53246 RepID=UPI000C665FBE|nr:MULTISPECIES: IS3 family transposase [unclassified Pseudoalteromonas]MAY58543.1 IS3 family transposase [Pseudoalteromonas sp.]MDN3407221.1 IS3 family transposase [Pseudoalteromonas sp. APC 3218]MDN3408852.1 IS3 family transposase [Pseudoalteromonas sp. APC 3894]MDN3416257.1 IS3 family transposase [Pseudoalteromonas sp. APC 3227]MDN3419955.1 IS3 family transposase [Pseudoalteromonas sp. APC 3895]